MRVGPPYPHSLGRVGFASQITQSFRTIRLALHPATFLTMWLAGVTRISFPRAGFILVGVFGGRFSLPVKTRPVMLLAKRGKIHARPKGCFHTCAVVSAVARIIRWLGLTFKSPLPSPHPSVWLVPASSCLPVPCLMPVSNPSAPRGGLPSFPFIVAQCSHSGAPRWRSRWVALFKGIGIFWNLPSLQTCGKFATNRTRQYPKPAKRFCGGFAAASVRAHGGSVCLMASQ